MTSAMDNAREAARALRRAVPFLGDVAVFAPDRPYLVAYWPSSFGPCDVAPWSPWIRWDGFPVYVVKAGSIPPLKPREAS